MSVTVVGPAAGTARIACMTGVVADAGGCGLSGRRRRGRHRLVRRLAAEIAVAAEAGVATATSMTATAEAAGVRGTRSKRGDGDRGRGCEVKDDGRDIVVLQGVKGSMTYWSAGPWRKAQPAVESFAEPATGRRRRPL